MILKPLAKALLRLESWTVVGEVPDVNKCVVIGAPHTSNWDFYYAMLFAFSVDLRPKILVKSELFKFPLKYLLRGLGGIPVYRNKKTSLVEDLAGEFNKRESLILALSPEGTRSKIKEWKSGFYRIAQKANVPVLLAYLDFKKKEAGFGPLFYPTGNYKEDIIKIRNFYADKTGKYPDKFV